MSSTENTTSRHGDTPTATELAAAIHDGRTTSVALVQACLDQIAEHDERIQAWAYVDPELALEQARTADQTRQRGLPLGPLHGLPVGIKDIFDTADMPTENGSVLYAGRRPTADATAVALLREAGAIILGKTVTTELAVFEPGATRNPHDPACTPGGSSSGSAAAVAAGMVPLTLGTQTNGSVIRPASFCGVFGYKPTHATVSRYRVLRQSRPLDTVGVFARTLADLALLADTLMVFDSRDPDMVPRGRSQVAAILAQDPPMPPRIAFVRTPVWDQAEQSTRDAFRELTEHLGETVEILDLPAMFEDAHELHRQIMEADLARSFAKQYHDGGDQLSVGLREMIERGQRVLATEYNEALERITVYNTLLERIMQDYDAILTPATPGEAPAGLDSTGSPVFCTIWSLCGVPALSLPIMTGPRGMPLGAQLLSMRGDDGRLFRTARWLLGALEQ